MGSCVHQIKFHIGDHSSSCVACPDCLPPFSIIQARSRAGLSPVFRPFSSHTQFSIFGPADVVLGEHMVK